MDSLWPSVLLGAALAALLLIPVGLFASAKRKGLPPGPPRLPLLGNILQLGRKKALWISMTKWGKEYGPVMSVDAFGKPLVVLNGHTEAYELLDRRSGIYSDRPKNIVVGELLTKGYVVSITRHNDSWRRMRRASHEAVGPQAYRDYFPQHEIEASVLISTLLDAPDDFIEHIRRASNSLMVSLIYGLPPIMDSKDPIIVWIDNAARWLGIAATPGAYFVEFLPWMMYLPRWMCKWRTDAERWHVETSKKFRELMDDVRARMDTGMQHPCIAGRLLKGHLAGDLSMEEAMWTSSTLYMAGAETSSSQMAWFILAILLHPSVQTRAHEELDRLVGQQRMPTFNDFNNLMYIQAIAKEVMRWRPITPMATPHSVEMDDTYLGYTFPKGTTFIANVWGLNHDAGVYGDDAHEFKPERFLDPTGQITIPQTIDTKDEGHLTYGFGRRICVGRYVANSNMFIQIASILWAFRILPDVGPDGTMCPPDADLHEVSGIFSTPQKFKCKFVSRFPDVPNIVRIVKEENLRMYNA